MTNTVVKNEGNKTACTKNSWRLLAMGKPTGNVWKETIAVSATIRISVEKLHHQIRLRSLSCSKMGEKASRTRSPRGKSPKWVERLDGLARITSEELAITHPVKDGILQNACTTRPRVVVGLGEKCLYAHRQVMNNLVLGLQRIMTKVQ